MLSSTDFIAPSFLERRGMIWALLFTHFAFWFVYALAVHNFAPLHGDMLEAYFWGQNFELGYYKHPPFWAWVCGLWFRILPTQNWAFLLLCSVNASIGLAGIWAVLGRFCTGPRRDLALLLLFLTPLYTFTIFQFNANTIFISLWPWTIFFFLKSLEKRELLFSLLFGVLGAAMLLSKYSAIFLLLSCLLAAILHSNARPYFRSLAPWISVVTIAILCLPHLFWLMTHDYLPLHYVEGRLNNSLAFTLSEDLAFIVSLLLQYSVVIALFLFVLRKTSIADMRAHYEEQRDSNRNTLVVLSYLPILLMLLSGTLASIKFSVNLTQAFTCFIPLTLTAYLAPEHINRLRRMAYIGILIVAGLVTIAAPFIAVFVIKSQKGQMTEPWIEAAREAQSVWKREAQAPLKIATGTNGYSGAISFYASEHPVQWTDLNFSRSPWLTQDQICRDGVLAVCLSEDKSCEAGFRTLAPSRIKFFEARVRRTYWGLSGPERTISILVLPPESCPINFAR